MRVVLGIAALLLAVAGCGPCDPIQQFLGTPDPDNPKTLFTKDKAIEMHLAGRNLTEVEGIWSWADKLYEVVIFRSRELDKIKYPEYDFVALITDAQDPTRRSDVKLLLKSTDTPSNYSGMFFGPQGQRYKTTFKLKSRDLLETTIPSGPYGRDQTILMLRTYPKGT